jgi:hypothetical protein
MRTALIKKILATQLVVFVVLLTFIVPRSANAIPVEDVGNMAQNTITAISSTASEATSFANNYKEMVLDPLANGLAKMVVQKITQSIVGWINSGFEGSPSFIQNPGSFFLDIADQATGQFITGPILQSMCSPFSIDIRIALAFKYHPRVLPRYACTLGTIIRNSVAAGKNASINGFTAGDFKQGGWPAFVSLTTEPQNNIYSAYLQAEYDLSYQVASLRDKKQKEIDQGRGFLSWRDPKCTKSIRDSKKQQAQSNSSTYDPATDTYVYDPNGSVDSTGGEVSTIKSEADCPILTPGSVIAGSLDKQLGSGTDQLNLADEFGEIVNALFAALVTKVIGATGLAGSSQRDSNGRSYLTQMNAEINQGSPEADRRKRDLLDSIKPAKDKANEYRTLRSDALNIELGILNTYNSAKLCYNTKLSAVPATLTPAQRGIAEARIAEIDRIISNGVASTTASLLRLTNEADEHVTTLTNIEAKANAAVSLYDIGVPVAEYGRLVQDRSLIDAIDISTAKTDLEWVRNGSANQIQDASRKVQACQVFPVGLTY